MKILLFCVTSWNMLNPFQSKMSEGDPMGPLKAIPGINPYYDFFYVRMVLMVFAYIPQKKMK